MEYVSNEVLAALVGGATAVLLPSLLKAAPRKKKGSSASPTSCVFALLASLFGGMCVTAAKQAVQSSFTVKLNRQTLPLHSDDGVVQHKSAYYGQIALGYPVPQYMDVVFDTGSGHVVVPSVLCKSPSCKKHRRYKRRPSTTAQDIDVNGNASAIVPGQPRDMLSISFGTGEVSGVFLRDYTCLGSQGERDELIRQKLAGPEGSVKGASLIQVKNIAAAKVQVEQQELSEAEEKELERAENMLQAEEALGKDGCADMQFIYATEMSSEPFESLLFDGIVGLGLPPLSETPNFNFLNVMANSGAWESKPGLEYTFAVFLGFTDEEDSEITFGGVRQEHIAEGEFMSWHDVPDAHLGYWQIKIHSISANGTKLDFCDDGTCRAIVDTGTSLVAVPADIGDALVDRLRFASHNEDGCAGAGPALEFDLGNYSVVLDPSDVHRPEFTLDRAWQGNMDHDNETKDQTMKNQALALPEGEPKYCVPMLMSIQLGDPLSEKTFIFGEPAIQKYYVAFDASPSAPRVGFAEAHHIVKRPPRTFMHTE